MKRLLIFFFMVLLSFGTVDAFTIEENVTIKPNTTSFGHYKIYSTVNLGNLTFNETHVLFRNLDIQNQTVKNVDTGDILCIGSENCSLPYTDTIINITFISDKPDTNFLVWNSTEWKNVSTESLPIFICGKTTFPDDGCTESNVEPEYQTSSQATYNLTNNGTLSGIGKIKLSDFLINISIMCDDDNTVSEAVNLTTTNQDICGMMSINDSCTIWCWANFTNFNPPVNAFEILGEVFGVVT
jgi:hypothetical protein